MTVAASARHDRLCREQGGPDGRAYLAHGGLGAAPGPIAGVLKKGSPPKPHFSSLRPSKSGSIST